MYFSGVHRLAYVDIAGSSSARGIKLGGGKTSYFRATCVTVISKKIGTKGDTSIAAYELLIDTKVDDLGSP